MTLPRQFFFRSARLLAIASCCIAGALSLPAAAQTPEAIQQKGTLTVGVQAEFPPWGSIDQAGNNVGYDIDVAKVVAADLGVKLQFVPVTAGNRVAYLTTGKVDMLIAAVGMYPDRAKAVQFSKPYATLDGVVYAKKSANIRSWTDLAGLQVGAARGSAADVAMTKDAPPTAKLLRFEDDAAPIQALLSEQVDAIGSTNLVALVLARSPAGSKFEQKFSFTRQYNGIATRLDQPAINAWLNACLDRNLANGKLDAINVKWTGAKLPAFPSELPGVPFEAK